MKTIYKYSITTSDFFTLNLPTKSKILKIATIDNLPYMWVEQETENNIENRIFHISGTGYNIPKEMYLEYIDTFFEDSFGSLLVWHLYEQKEI